MKQLLGLDKMNTLQKVGMCIILLALIAVQSAVGTVAVLACWAIMAGGFVLFAVGMWLQKYK